MADPIQEKRVGEMQGPFPLKKDIIEAVVLPKPPGIFLLFNGIYSSPKYVGRADRNLAKALKTWIGKYHFFKFDFCASPEGAFLRECSLYHHFAGSRHLENGSHPQRPPNFNWRCPVCKIFE
ncbi:hypothetical protein ISS37_07465 [candidate division KSB1 bacterium]|nr:hypothetical protein [candidate division KSB1 bacterium]